MRTTLLATLMLGASAFAACAGSPISREEAADRVRSDGFSLISKTEPAPGSWDVWAAKDGIPYEVKVDSGTGAVVKEVPLEDND